MRWGNCREDDHSLWAVVETPTTVSQKSRTRALTSQGSPSERVGEDLGEDEGGQEDILGGQKI